MALLCMLRFRMDVCLRRREEENRYLEEGKHGEAREGGRGERPCSAAATSRRSDFPFRSNNKSGGGDKLVGAEST